MFKTLNHKLFTIITVVICAFGLSSCLDNEGYINSFSVGKIHQTENLPEIQEADALLLAIRKVAYVEQAGFAQVKTLGEAKAIFKDVNNTNAYADVGNVAVNESYLIKRPGNEYVFNVDLTTESGYIFNDFVHWQVDGNDNFLPFDKIVNIWPDVGPVNSSKFIYTGSDYELSIQYVTDAHATSFQIAGLESMLKKYKEDSHLSHTFTAEEIDRLGRGPGIVQVNAYYIQDTIVNGNLIYTVNAEASYEVVEIR